MQRDEQVGEAIDDITGLPRIDPTRPDNGARMVLEGGGIETDGAGTLLVTEEWLLSDVQVRNPGLTREDYEQAFASRSASTIPSGWVKGASATTLTGTSTTSRASLRRASCCRLRRERRRREPCDLAGQSSPGSKRQMRGVKLPYPRPLIMDGQRLPASYANFYIANGVVLVPTFNDPNDRVALESSRAISRHANRRDPRG